MLTVEKELFQWERGRYVTVDNAHPEISTIEFYNQKSKYTDEISVVEGRAKIPNYLLRDDCPIIALACETGEEGPKVVCKKTFKVLPRPRPEYYEDNEDEPIGPEIPIVDIIYDGGEP